MSDINNPQDNEVRFFHGKRYMFDRSINEWREIKFTSHQSESKEEEFYPPATVRQVHADYLKGVAPATIAKKYDVAIRDIYNWSKRWRREQQEVREIAVERVAGKLSGFSEIALDRLIDWVGNYKKIEGDIFFDKDGNAHEGKQVDSAQKLSRMVKDLFGLLSPGKETGIINVYNQANASNSQSLTNEEMKQELDNDPLTNPNAVQPK